MNNTEKIIRTVLKSIATADTEEIADIYKIVVACADCPYAHDCRIENDCFDYIFHKLEADNDQKETKRKG